MVASNPERIQGCAIKMKNKQLKNRDSNIKALRCPEDCHQESLQEIMDDFFDKGNYERRMAEQSAAAINAEFWAEIQEAEAIKKRVGFVPLIESCEEEY